MNVDFKCGDKSVENVAEFKYLGLIINRAKNHPGEMLAQRINKAKGAFYRIKCHARLLGLHNRRVRISLVQAIAVTTLLYGSVIFGCLGPARLQLTGGAQVFIRAEMFMRKMLRWALKTAPVETRVSMLYLATNSTNM
jgi:hypothetical protein